MSDRDMVSVVICFCEAKIKLFETDKIKDLADLFKIYSEQEKVSLSKIYSYYRSRWGEKLSDIIFTYPWRSLDRLLLRIIIFPNNFAKTIARFQLLEEESEKLYEIASWQAKDIATCELFFNFKEISAKRNLAIKQYIANLDETKILDEQQKHILLSLIQPGLAGLMDGSVSTLGPIFAAAFATNNTRDTFLVGLSASIGAGISMGFTEAIHDDGKLSGRGSPIKRGLANGIMTAIGGLGHTLPYLIKDFKLATIIAIIVVFIELWIIVWIQNKYMKIPFSRATIQVVLGGALVFFAGIFIGLA